MEKDPTLDIEVVKQRFLDSEAALRQISDQLQDLRSATERAQSDAASLEALARSIEGFSAIAGQVAERLAELLAALQETVDQARPVLSGEVLERLRSDFANAHTEVRDELTRRLAVVEEEMERLMRALPRRWHRRAGGS